MPVLAALACLLLALLPGTSGDQLVVYPHPPGVNRSSHFQLRARQGGGAWQELFVYQTTSDQRAKTDKHTHPNRSVSWASFAFSGSPVTVQVSAWAPFQTCRVLPSSYAVPCNRTGDKEAEFQVGANVTTMSVELDTGVYEGEVRHKLLVFADAPETDVPDPSDPQVLYFGVGVHRLPGKLTIPDSKTWVYLAPGALVYGGLYINATRHVKISGRGILSGTPFAHKEFLGGMLDVGNGERTLVEGITVADPVIRYCRMKGNGGGHVTLDNVKFLGAWTATTGGVSFADYGVVVNSFINSDDDTMMLNADYIRAQRCVFWQSKNGAVFQLGWTETHSNHDILMQDIDVIHTDWCMYKRRCHKISHNNAVFDLAASVNLQLTNYTFRNIRFEGVVPRFFHMVMNPKGQGYVTNLLFENVELEAVDSTFGLRSRISGSSRANVSDWLFLNLTVGGRCVSDISMLNLELDNKTTSNISFECPETAEPLSLS